ncbi:MAG: transcription elongation factor GreA [Clostridia bacterium]|nr:transcription elongation factor GreA [Clostridia bacterium]MBR7186047.1 transcription elongation factor GreA [Clostridia bacterium]
MADKFYMTSEEKAQAEERLKHLTTVKRAEIIERIQEARSHGDLSENAEYDAARNEQAALEGEIAELDYQIKNAEIIKEVSDTSVVHIGSKVTVYDDDLEEEATYTIMGTTGADPMKNIISNESPVGAALLGKKKGTVVAVKAPDGEYTLKILKIE